METESDVATIEPPLEFVECEARENAYGPSALLGEDEVSFTEDRGPFDASVAVAPFSAAPRVRLLGPKQNAAAMAWNKRMHPAESGVDPDLIRARMDGHVDVEALRQLINEQNAKVAAADRIEVGSLPIDAAFVEAVHQYQHYCFAEDALVDGKAGAATLDSLGLVRRSGLRHSDANEKQRRYLKEKAQAISRATGGEFKADTWFDDFVNPSFLGWTFRHGVHPILVRKLRAAEAALLSMKQYQGYTPRRLGRELGITERHGGSRPEDATMSMHTVGLAIDINYTGNPWIGGKNFAEVMRNAILLISGETVDFTSAHLHSIRKNSTADIADELRKRSNELVEYLRLISHAQQLHDKLDARRSTKSVWKQGESIDEAVERWGQTVASDLKKLEKNAKFGPEHDPRHGFIDLPTTLAVALRDTACLAWGAVDFGDKQSGDVMHFDCRPDGVGRVLNRGYEVVDGVPCVAAKRTAARTTEELEEADEPGFAESATDPIVPARLAISVAKSVGRGGKNEVADVGRVQDTLLALRYLAAADYAKEHPAAGATGAVPVANLPATIAAIEALQRDFAISPLTGRVNPGASQTLAALNRAIPRPTAAEFTAVATQRASITETITRGVTIGHPVGRVPDAEVAGGNANIPGDVDALQRRLVGLGYLKASHGETPGAAAPRAINLSRTIAAITAFQGHDVVFWRDKKNAVTGTVRRGVVEPGDATHTLLDSIGTYREAFTGGDSVQFSRDFVVVARNPKWVRSSEGVDFNGTVQPSTLPVADYVAAGLTPAQANALRFVSTHEGDFDALNTFDVAIVTLGFVQFAGGNRSFEPFMALLKSRRPAEFRSLFVDFGIDVEFNVSGGRSENETIVILDPTTSTVVRGLPAERAIRASKKLSAVVARAGRNTEVQRVQVEAATRQFVLPAITMRIQYDADVVQELAAPGGAVIATHVGRDARTFRAGSRFATLQSAGRIRESHPRTTSTLGDRIRSERGMAVLFDRAVQEGGSTGPKRTRAAVLRVADEEGLPDITAIDPHEQRVLDSVLDDLRADIEIAQHLDAAVAAVQRLSVEAKKPSVTVAAVLAHAAATTARNELDSAIAAVAGKLDLPAHFEPTRTTLEATLRAQRTNLDVVPGTATKGALLTQLQAVIRRLQAVTPDEGNAAAFARRVNDILTTTRLTGPPP